VEYQIVYKKPFTDRLEEVLDYLDEEWGARVAQEFYLKITRVIELLKLHPQIGMPSRVVPGVRGVSVTKHNRMFYRIDKKKVIILSLSDTRRKDFEG